jgi:HNH endonuclease/NUMOD4 motif-containing protein/CENP-B-like protein
LLYNLDSDGCFVNLYSLIQILMQQIEAFSPFGDYCEVSNHGRVRSKKDNKILNPFIAHRGHLRISLYVNGKQGKFYVHRLVAMAFIPNPGNKEFVNHKDGNPANNHVNNLEWATRQENENHAFATGLKNSSGINNGRAKLNEEKIRLIRFLSESGVSRKSLSTRFGVGISNIQRILTNQLWKSV